MSKIEWTDSVWEPVGGCRHASEGCRNCYAETLLGNLSGITPSRFRPIPRRYDGLVQLRSKRSRFTGEIAIWPDKLVQPLNWRKPRTVFVCSQSDLFYEERPFSHVAAVYAVMAATPHIRYLVLTKRPERRREFFEWLHREAEAARCSLGDVLLYDLNVAVDDGQPSSVLAKAHILPALFDASNAPWPRPNIGEGVSVEDQATADARIPVLLSTPAAMRFVSYEPALGPVGFRDFLPDERGVSAYRRTTDGQVDVADALLAHGDFRVTSNSLWTPLAGIDWVIAGAESGPGARPAELDWFRAVRDQCQSAGVAFFLKQADVCESCSGTGTRQDVVPVSGPHYECRPCNSTCRAGKVRKHNPALDGQVHDARPAWIAGGAR